MEIKPPIMAFNFPVGSERDMAELIRLAARFMTGNHVHFSEAHPAYLQAFREFHEILKKYRVIDGAT